MLFHFEVKDPTAVMGRAIMFSAQSEAEAWGCMRSGGLADAYTLVGAEEGGRMLWGRRAESKDTEPAERDEHGTRAIPFCDGAFRKPIGEG